MQSKNVIKALGYAQKLIGTKYGIWKGGQSTRDVEGPFWVAGKKLPAAKYVKDRTCNCAGLINLMRRAVRLSIPGAERAGFQYAGGTYTWFQYLEKNVCWKFLMLIKNTRPARYCCATTKMLMNRGIWQ